MGLHHPVAEFSPYVTTLPLHVTTLPVYATTLPVYVTTLALYVRWTLHRNRDMAHLFVWHDVFTCVPWSIHLRDMTTTCTLCTCISKCIHTMPQIARVLHSHFIPPWIQHAFHLHLRTHIHIHIHTHIHTYAYTYLYIPCHQLPE